MGAVTVLEPRFHIEIGEAETVDAVGPDRVVSGIVWSFARAAFTRERAEEVAVELAWENEHVRIVDREADGDRRVRRVADAIREFLPSADQSAMVDELQGAEIAFDGVIDLERLATAVLAAADRGEP